MLLCSMSVRVPFLILSFVNMNRSNAISAVWSTLCVVTWIFILTIDDYVFTLILEANVWTIFIFDKRDTDFFISVIALVSIHKAVYTDKVFFRFWCWTIAFSNWNKSMDHLKKWEIQALFTVRFSVYLLWKHMSRGYVWMFHARNKNHIFYDALADELEYEWTNHRQWILSWNNWYHKLLVLQHTLLLYIF